METVDASQIEPVTPESRRWVRYVLGFTVGVAIGLAPFLGVVEVPGFKALLNLMPFQLQADLIPFSAFLMGVVAVAVQFYGGGQISDDSLQRRFRLGLRAILVGFVAFMVLWMFFTERVERGSDKVTVMIGPYRASGCDCKTPNNVQCIKELGLDEAAIASCWRGYWFTGIGLLLRLAYLGLMGGFGSLVGLVLLRESLQRREEAQRRAQEAAQRKAQKQAERKAHEAERKPRAKRGKRSKDGKS